MGHFEVWTVYEMAKPPGARGGIQIMGMVRGEWLRLGHCWHLASPRRFGGFQVVARVLVLAWVSAFVVSRELAAPTAVTRVSERGFFSFLASVRELAAPTAVMRVSERGFFSFLASVRDLAAPTAGIFATACGFRGPRGQGLGIPWSQLGCQGAVVRLVVVFVGSLFL